MAAELRRRLLVLGADALRASAFLTWARMGLHTVLVDGHSSARYEHLVEESFSLDVRDETADLHQLIQLARTCDGVTTLSDQSQCITAAVAAELGIPGTGVRAAAAARSKSLQRELAREAGMEVPDWKEIHSVDALVQHFASHTGPVVLKPNDSAGSNAVHKVDDLARATALWPEVHTLSPSDKGILETYVPGSEVSVEAVVVMGDVHALSVTRKETGGPTGFIETAHHVAAEQSALRQQAATAVSPLVSAFTVETGVVHAEFKVDDSAWVLIEAAVRPPGDLIPELTRRVTGLDLYHAQAMCALGEAADATSAPVGPGSAPHAAVRFVIGEGPVRRFVAPAEVLNTHTDVKIVHQLAQPGRRLRAPLGSGGRAGYVVGWGVDHNRLDAETRHTARLLGEKMGLAVLSPLDLRETHADGVGAGTHAVR